MCPELTSTPLLFQISNSSTLSHPTHLQSQESQPISLRYDDQNPHWSQTVRFFLTRPGLHSLDLRFSSPQHLPILGACIARSSPSLSSLRLESQGPVGLSQNQDKNCWTLGFLRECAQLRELNLGRGKWKLNKQCVNAPRFKSIRKLTLEHVDFGSLSFQLLQSITPQLHEFTLYEDGNVLREYPHVPSTSRLTFFFPNALLLRFRFASTELHLTLSVSPAALKTLSVMAKRLILSCKGAAPLTLDHLSLYGRERLDISSLRRASARVAYLDGPTNDQDAVKSRMRARRRLSKAIFKPPSFRTLNLRFLFFHTRKACNAPTLAALRQDYPALVLYCVVDRSFYWHRKGQLVRHGPLEHVRRSKSGVWDKEEGKKRAKNVTEKMHSVNRKLVEGYWAEEDQVYVMQYQQK
ncbi:unnamed protein product [Closterium sp. Naga37s-1]|nr:unnamed protein product [Closterium sp. Naga37s-1]